MYLHLEKSVASDSSSGVCCINATPSYETGNDEGGPEHLTDAESKFPPGSMCVCLENYNSELPGHLQLSQGDIIEGTESLKSVDFFNNSISTHIVHFVLDVEYF